MPVEPARDAELVAEPVEIGGIDRGRDHLDRHLPVEGRLRRPVYATEPAPFAELELLVPVDRRSVPLPGVHTGHPPRRLVSMCRLPRLCRPPPIMRSPAQHRHYFAHTPTPSILPPTTY